MAWFKSRKPGVELIRAIARGNVGEIAPLLRQQDFTLIEAADAAGGGGKAAMTAEFDDYPVLVAFTTGAHAAAFAGANRDLLDPDGTMPAFVVSGTNLLAYLPDGFGVVLNPESNDEAAIPPQMIGQIKNAP
jgi:hypothetical protein